MGTLEDLRKKFDDNQISSLPKPTKNQTTDVKNNVSLGIRCKLCGQWHHKDVIHLDYVGHAALTDRFLSVDPNWNWKPMALQDGLPKLDADGGLWIELTILGQTRFGYGNADHNENKSKGDRLKEIIGDALRNAGMRFGCALDLWHKGELHKVNDEYIRSDIDQISPPVAKEQQPKQTVYTSKVEHPKELKPYNETKIKGFLENCKTKSEVDKVVENATRLLEMTKDQYDDLIIMAQTRLDKINEVTR